jgi:hypothetical protein
MNVSMVELVRASVMLPESAQLKHLATGSAGQAGKLGWQAAGIGKQWPPETHKE